MLVLSTALVLSSTCSLLPETIAAASSSTATAAPTTASEFAVAVNKGFKQIRDGSEGD